MTPVERDTEVLHSLVMMMLQRASQDRSVDTSTLASSIIKLFANSEEDMRLILDAHRVQHAQRIEERIDRILEALDELKAQRESLK